MLSRSKRRELASLSTLLNEEETLKLDNPDSTIDNPLVENIPVVPKPKRNNQYTKNKILDHATAVQPPKPILTSTSRKEGEVSSDDEHNESCEVCETGGDLVCCDTCSLVFHLSCIRPHRNAVPIGPWSCAHCIAEV